MFLRGLAVLAALLTFSPSAAAECSLAEWANGFVQPVLGGPFVTVHSQRLLYGRLEILLAEGHWAPVRVCGRVVGAFFAGFGSFRYAVNDSVFEATWHTNVKDLTDYDVDTDGAITDQLQTLLLLLSSGADTLAQDPFRAQGEAVAEPALEAAFQKHLERRLHDNGGRFDSLLPQAMTDPPQASVVVAEIGTGRHDLLLVRDTFRDEKEILAVMHRRDADDDKDRDLLALCVQPLGREWLQSRPGRYLLAGLDVSLTNESGDRATLTIREALVIQTNLRTLEFLLYNDFVEDNSSLGPPTYRPYEVTSVTDAEGHALSFLHRYGTLVVELPQSLPAGSRIELIFGLAGEVLIRPNRDNYWLLLGSWYPQPRRWDMEAYTYHAICKVRKPFVPFACGRTVRRWEEGDLACAEFRESQAVEWAFLLAGKYFTHTVEQGGLTVRVSTYAARDDDRMKQIASLVLGIIQFYRPLMGDFPFSELNVVEINSLGFGIAPAGTIFITHEAFARIPLEGYAGLFVEGINRRLAHEVAHAWWGHVAKLAAEEDQWVSESVAEYYSAFALGQMKGKEEFDAAFRDWKRWANEVAERGTLYLANHLSGEDADEQRYRLLYGKGPLMLHALRHEVGDNTFFTILKSYLRSFHFKPATTRDFIGITNFITKQDYAPFFDRYLFGTGKVDVKK